MPLKKKNQVVQKVIKKTVASDNGGATKASKRGDYIPAVGRRKTAIARVRLYRGGGDNTVNGKPVTAFFSHWVNRNTLLEPLFATDSDKAFSFSAKVLGGGVNAQAEAIALGISRALVKFSIDHKLTLRKKGFLTRDPRMRETRKIGTGGKARRAKQSPKR